MFNRRSRGNGRYDSLRTARSYVRLTIRVIAVHGLNKLRNNVSG